MHPLQHKDFDFNWIAVRTKMAFLAMLLVAISCTSPEKDARPWFKGNLHTHTLWSDGDDYPEMVIAWYKEKGYHFLALSDHNTLAEGERWLPVSDVRGSGDALARYVEKFGVDWVVQKEERDTVWVRLKTFEEYRAKFEEAGEFIVVQSEEITDRFEQNPIHVNATNIQEFIAPRGGASVSEVMQRNVDAVLAQRERLGVPMIPHINHPNFGWAITVEDLMALNGEQFFEVYNGHPLVHNYGEDQRPGMERMWDIILADRLRTGRQIMYGIAVDDGHNYHEMGPAFSNPGRAWVMVRADSLTPDALIASMERGDFYGSTGVVLTDIVKTKYSLTIDIAAEAGVTYQTQFIGTRAGHDSSSTAIEIDSVYVSRSYSDEIGAVLSTVDGVMPAYEFTGDELYVRAKIISSKAKENPYSTGEMEMAWTQPALFPSTHRTP